MPAGELRERVAFEARMTPSRDDYGNVVTGEWREQFQCAARLQPTKGIGNESVQAARLSGTQPMIIRVRLSSQTKRITGEWRARDTRRGTIFNIRSMANMDERGAYLDLLCMSGEAEG
jgi:head-tail adaptor